MKNYLMFKDFSIFFQKYIFVDVEELLYERLLRDAGVRIKEAWEYAKKGSSLKLIICRIPKKDREKFESAVGRIRNNALLMGYRDYDETCQKLQDLENIL